MKKILFITWLLLPTIAVTYEIKPTVHLKTINAEKNGIIVADAYISERKSTATTTTTTWAFMNIVNTTDTDDVLLGIVPDPDFVARLEIHRTKTQNGVARMEKIPELPIAANQVLQLQPGGYHIMVIGLKNPVVYPNVYPVTLHFKNAGDIAISVAAKAKKRIRVMRNRDKNPNQAPECKKDAHGICPQTRYDKYAPD